MDFSPSDDDDFEFAYADLVSSPLILSGSGGVRRPEGHVSVVEVVAAALRRSLVICGGEDEDKEEEEEENCSEMEIGEPTEVRHVAHVTFDRFDGFIGLPVELEPEVPSRVPSASVSIFGVSAESMQCSFDNRGNSVPTILLSMQSHLYSQGGLQVEGIFRINAEKSQEVCVREQLNAGVVPAGIDLHCLAGLIKAWFRELPSGVLDSLTPDQVMQCNSEEECERLVRLIPPPEAALLDWSINLMADVVEHECCNKMNAQSIAMVFAPNMSQMADPLSALIHAVQVMNFLKTLVLKTLREREEAATEFLLLRSFSESPMDGRLSNSVVAKRSVGVGDQGFLTEVLFGSRQTLNYDSEGSSHGYEKKSDGVGDFISGTTLPSKCNLDISRESGGEFCNRYSDILSDRFSLREGIKKLFHLRKSTRKASDVVIFCSGEQDEEV